MCSQGKVLVEFRLGNLSSELMKIYNISNKCHPLSLSLPSLFYSVLQLYIILVRPERNVRQSMMPPRYGNMHRTAGTGPSSMMAAAVVTAATCAQEEKIQKHITPTETGMLHPLPPPTPPSLRACTLYSFYFLILLFDLLFFLQSTR